MFKYDYDGMTLNSAILKASEVGDLKFISHCFQYNNMGFHVLNNIVIDNAAKGGHLELVEYLVERGAKVQRAIKYGTEEIKEWAIDWKNTHPGKQKIPSFVALSKRTKTNDTSWIEKLTVEQLSNLEKEVPKDLIEVKDAFASIIQDLRNKANEETSIDSKNKIKK